MIILHDFFTQRGGGENLIVSISQKYNANIYTLLNKSYKSNNKIVEVPKLNIFKFYNKIIFFIISSLLLRIKTQETILFSGNFVSLSIWRCQSPNKIIYHHTLPKSIFNDQYIGFDNKFIYNFFKKPLILFMEFNYLKAKTIYFNSIKSKNKFLKIYPNYANKNSLKILYPFSSFSFNNINNNFKKNYIVINSRHAKEKNIYSILDVIKNNPLINCYVTNNGILNSFIKKKYNIFNNIICCGYLDSNKYHALLNDALAVVLPAYDEDFGIGALDAYNLNVPLLLYKNAGFSEILSDKYELFLDNNSLLELINKIKKNKNFNYFENKLNLNKLFFDEFNQYK